MTPRNPRELLRGAFSLEKDQESGRVCRIACTYKHWTQDAFYLDKTRKVNRRNLGGIVARPLCVGKGSGIWEGLAASYLNLKSHWTRDPRYILLEKTQGIVGLVRRAFPLKKNTESGRLAASHFHFQLHWIEGVFYFRKTQGSWWGLRATRIFLETTRNPGGREQSHVSSQSTCTRPFIFAGWWRRCIWTRKRDGVGCSFSSRTHGCDVQTFLKKSTWMNAWQWMLTHCHVSSMWTRKSFSKVACRTPAQRMCQQWQKSRAPQKPGALFHVPCLFFSELNCSLCEMTFSSGLFSLINKLTFGIVKSVKHKSTNITFTTHSHRMALWAMLQYHQANWASFFDIQGPYQKGNWSHACLTQCMVFTGSRRHV